MQILWKLFTSFFKTGLFTFGGGYAMLPLLKAEVVEKQKWATEDELLDYFSIGQCTPGIIAVNVSTFCGYKLKGVIGAITATTAIILPSLIIITLIAAVLEKYMHLPAVASAFAGIRLGVTALLVNLIFDMGKKIFTKNPHWRLHAAIFSIAFALLMFGDVSAVLIVIMAEVFGFVPNLFGKNKISFIKRGNKK